MRESVAWSIVRFRSNQTGQAIKAGQAEGRVGGMGGALLSPAGVPQETCAGLRSLERRSATRFLRIASLGGDIRYL